MVHFLILTVTKTQDSVNAVQTLVLVGVTALSVWRDSTILYLESLYLFLTQFTLFSWLVLYFFKYYIVTHDP